MKKPLAKRRVPVRRFRIEALESRRMLTASPDGSLLVQLTPQANTQAVSQLAAASGATAEATTVAGLVEVSGSSASLAEVTAGAASTPGVKFVEPNQTLHLTATPNDPDYLNGDLYNLNGQNGINAPAAWNVTTGSPSTVTIADIDTGADYDQPDLYQNIWINQAEIPASRLKNLVDVYHDGYISWRDLNNPINIGPGKITDVNGDGVIDAADILAPMILNAQGQDTGLGGWANPNNVQDGDTAHPDDLIGWNFVDNNNDPLDVLGHGTHTAGTIGASGDNGVGVTGVNWNTQIMLLQIFDASGDGTEEDAIEAIQYAAEHGARVANASWGANAASQALSDAIQQAGVPGAAGTPPGYEGLVFVAAAGNNGTDNGVTPFYPAAYQLPNEISVAATDINGNLASFSDYGATTVDLGAPGVNITSTLPNGVYGVMSGTSMAAPEVTGTVGLLAGLEPDWTADQLVQRILSTVTPDPALAGKTITGGIVNAGAAILSVTSTPTPTPPPTPTPSATFVGSDATTQGNWEPVYGSDAYLLAGDSASTYPPYAQITMTGESNYSYGLSESDPRALQNPIDPPGRFSSVWYSGSSFTIGVDLTDGASHRVSIYAADYDDYLGGRDELVQVLNATTGAVLDSETLTSFQGGVYLSWVLAGDVELKFTNEGGPSNNAVVSGLFFGAGGLVPASSPTPTPTPTATFSGSDATTQGNWESAYGSDGYALAGDAASYPSYAQVSLVGASSYTYALSPSDPRALQSVLTPGGRVASVWYSSTSFTIGVDLTDGASHRISIYAADYDDYQGGRDELVQVLNATTGAVLDSETLTSFQNGVYLSWIVSGDVTLKFTNEGGPSNNTVVSGLFFGAGGLVSSPTPTPTPTPTATASATFSGSDTTTEGNWESAYGSDGYVLAGDAASYPSYAQVSLLGTSSYTYALASDPRALQSVLAPGSRVASVWYSATSFTIGIDLTDGASHRVSIYAADYDDYQGGRDELVQVLNATTGAVLDTETLTSFQNGVYLSWIVSGDVTLKFTNEGGPSNNAVVSGLFFGAGGLVSSPTPTPTPTATATFSGSDTITQGNWESAYGSDGYTLAGDAASYPPYALVSMVGALNYTYALSPSDPRALQSVSAPGSRVASVWYSATSFTIGVDLTDGASHRVSIYAADYDDYQGGRDELVQVLNATTGAVLNSETLTSFQNGVYLSWIVSGDVTLKFTNEGGPSNNAVVSGLFFGAGGLATTQVNHVQIDDGVPAGASWSISGGGPWYWVGSSPTPYSGTEALQSDIASGLDSSSFLGLTGSTLTATSQLYAYVYLDPVNMPTEIMLQWNDGSSWGHRAYWGANDISLGTNGTVSQIDIGTLPASGGWVRLDVSAAMVGMVGQSVNGVAFTLYSGRATWDYSGYTTTTGS